MTRNTHQKQQVFKVLKSLRGEHPTADDVYKQVSQAIPSISRATVFRILNNLAAEGTINQLRTPDLLNRYDDWILPHHHLLCSSCRKVIDLETSELKNFSNLPSEIAGCKVTGVDLVFRGLCPKCL